MKNSYIFMWEAVECSGLFISFTSISLRADCVPGSEQVMITAWIQGGNCSVAGSCRILAPQHLKPSVVL